MRKPTALVLSLLPLVGSALSAQELAFEGAPQPITVIAEDQRSERFHSLYGDEHGKASIRDILRLEASSTTVDNAIAMKRKGLRLVENLEDFAELSRYAFSNPSSSYKQAVSSFMAQNVSQFVQSRRDLSTLRRLEGRATQVDDAEMIKRAGLRVVQNLEDFHELIRYAFSNPSNSYRTMVSGFAVRNVTQLGAPSRDFDLLRAIEGYARTVDEAFEIKRFGLRAVQSTEDYNELLRPAFSNPSRTYTQERRQFLVRHIEQGIFSGTSVSQVLRLEGQTGTVDDAMRVKTVGLRVVSNFDEFMDLARSAFSNPSASYKRALSDFIQRHSDKFIQ